MVEGYLGQLSRDIDKENMTEVFEDAKLIQDTIGFRIQKNGLGHIKES